jgi:hypothetical protein
MTGSPRAHAAGVRKAPRHEIAEGGAPGGAAKLYGDLIVARDLKAVSEIVGLVSEHNFGVMA